MGRPGSKKCAWFIISFILKYGKASLVIPRATHRSPSPHECAQALHIKHHHRFIGPYNSTSTGMEFKRVMIKKIKLYSGAIDRSTLLKSEARLAYNAFYMNIIGYGTPSTSRNPSSTVSSRK
jgi:hypothetical protein